MASYETTMSTIQEIKHEPDLEEATKINPNEVWCIIRKDNPMLALCGARVFGHELPDAEVPDEVTCHECLELQRLIDSNK